MSLEKLFEHEVQIINRYLVKESESWGDSTFGMKELADSVRYSLLSDGKRFRPVLALLTARALNQDAERVLPFAAAVECIHAYSLIHDDLPLMDDDDERRGRPTNHKVYGEDIALLAGDALQAQAFHFISQNYKSVAQLALETIQLLAEAIGIGGMVGGQAIDVKALKGQTPNFEELRKLHALKTGALIRASVEGAAVLSGCSSKERVSLRAFGENLGFAFQLADDLLDYDPQNPEGSSFVMVMGTKETSAKLADATNTAINELKEWGPEADPLRTIAQYNQQRLLN